MAKLSARGRKELCRLTKTEKVADETSPASERRTTVALMDDGKILKKMDVVFRSDNRKHSYGWKVTATLKAGVTTERFVEIYEKLGFTKA